MIVFVQFNYFEKFDPNIALYVWYGSLIDNPIERLIIQFEEI